MATEKRLVTKSKLTAIGDAIRAHTGESGDIKLHEMPEKIGALLAKGHREVWLHGCQQRNAYLKIDTGVAGDINHTLEVVGYGNIYAGSTLFGSVTSGKSRQVCDLLTTTMKWRFAWGNSGIMAYEYPIETICPWYPATIRFNKNGFTVNGFAKGFNPASITEDYSASVTGGESTANYEIFPNVSSPTTSGTPGVFRSAKIFAADGVTLLHHFVPILYNDWKLALLDKVTNSVQALPENEPGFEAYYSPYTDTLVNL